MLDRREIVSEVLPEPVPAQTLRQDMLTLTAELEAELISLKDRLAANGENISEDDLRKLRNIREALQAIV